MFREVGSRESALFVQAYRIINEDIWRYYDDDKQIDEEVKGIWTSLHDRLARELGVIDLSARYFSLQPPGAGEPFTQTGTYDMNLVVQTWFNVQYKDEMDADVFFKRRLSFIELAFRERET